MKKPYWNLMVTILAFVGCFTCWRGWNRGVAKGTIEYVLKSDAECDPWLNKQTSSIEMANDDDCDKATKLIRTRIEAEREFKISRCPSDFQVAFIRYLGAWDNFATAFSAHPHVFGTLEGTITGFIHGIAGDFGKGVRYENEVTEWQKLLNQRIVEVDTAKTELDALAVKYGASLPPR